MFAMLIMSASELYAPAASILNILKLRTLIVIYTAIVTDVNRAAAANPDAAVGPRTIEEVATSYTDKKLVTVCGT